jgi:D-serine deaminase-like pyridoxal phosphate-dependent protein
MDWSIKGLWLPESDPATGSGPLPAPGSGLADALTVGLSGQNLFDGSFTWPVMVVRRSAIEANIAVMAAYCTRHGVEFAPHGKTTMSPTLFAAQLAAGAWGITVATANQALVARRFGVPRVLLANELLDPKVLRWAADETVQGWDFLCYVDSLAGVDIMRRALAGHPGRLRVLVEIGVDGGRAGCRTVIEAREVAAAVDAVPELELAGVAGFEGILSDPAAVESFLTTMVEALTALSPTPTVPTSEPTNWILSAGGSAFFDTVVDVFVPAARRHGWTVVLRSGAVVSHDDGFYATSTPFERAPDEGSLVAALEVWAQVLSTPEPGLAILGAGKRDLAFDLGLPVPVAARGLDGAFRALPGAVIERLNDQHAYLRDASVTPGELVRLGISHPCTAFDKWRVIPVVDDDYRVVDLLHTYF